MSMRAAVLTTGLQLEPTAVQAAVRDLLLPIEVRPIMPRLPFAAMLGLARYRPDLVVCDATGIRAGLAAVYRMLSPRSRLLLHASEPGRDGGWLGRLARRRADAVVARPDQVHDAIGRLRFPGVRIHPMQVPADLALFTACPRHREAASAYRIVFAGDLSPESGAADVFLCLCAWAEQHPDRDAEIWWLGDGDLIGVLQTQPLPDNLRQLFLPLPDRRGLAAAFAECGILVAPPVRDREVPLAAESLAAGLVVLAGCRSGARAGAPDFTFDPMRPDEMLAAFDQVLDLSTVELDVLRDRGRAMLHRALPEPRLKRAPASVAAAT